MLQARAPSVSRVLGARLVQSAGCEGMSAAAQRLHCAACSALLAPRARVRIQPDRRRRRGRRATRRNGEPPLKNRVVRTCEQCLARNYHNGSRKGESDEAKEWAAVRDPHDHKANPPASYLKRASCDLGQMSNPAENEQGDGPGPGGKRKKRKKAGSIAAGFLKQTDSLSAQNDPASLSSSFLFQPL
jgi:hypothetical protein